MMYSGSIRTPRQLNSWWVLKHSCPMMDILIEFREIFFLNGKKLAVDSNKFTDFLKILLSSCCKSCRVRLKGSETTKHLQHVDHVTFNLTEENLCIYWFFTTSRNSKSLFPDNFDRIVSEFEDNHRCALHQHFTRLSSPVSLISFLVPLYTDDLVHLNGRQVFVFRTTTGKFILSTTSLNLFGVILSMIVLSDDQSDCSFVFCRIDSQRMYQSWNLGTVTRTPG